MGEYVVLHDGVLIEGVAARQNVTTIETDGSVPLRQAFYSIRAAARAGSGRLHTVFVVCHGFAGTNTQARVWMDAGGKGLLLGKETVLHSNVAMWSAIQDMTANIVIYACAAAEAQSGDGASDADGKDLMSELAIHTNADVYAAGKVQWCRGYQHVTRGPIDFGGWEGSVWHFPAGGKRPQRVNEVPIPLSHVMGTASS